MAKKTLKNIQMLEMLRALTPLLSHKDIIGYFAARNYRILDDCLIEYKRFRDELIKKYGDPDLDENGNKLPTISLNVNSPNFKKFYDELDPFNNIEHEVDIMVFKYKDAIGSLTGEEILNIDWMLED